MGETSSTGSNKSQNRSGSKDKLNSHETGDRRFSLLSTATQLNTKMIADMPSKLFQLYPKRSFNTKSNEQLDRSSRTNSFIIDDPSTYFSMTISACEVIPSVFRGFKSACTEKVRFIPHIMN